MVDINESPESSELETMIVPGRLLLRCSHIRVPMPRLTAFSHLTRLPGTPMAPLAHGTYSITNVKFLNVAVLPDDNHDSDIVGRPEENSLHGKWVVSRLENGRYTIKSQAIPHFASSVFGAEEGDSVYGGKRAKQLVIKETKFKGRYTISPADADLFWGLLDSETNTPIALANVATDPKNQWIFTPIVDMAQHLPNSVHTESRGQVNTAYETPHMSSIAPHMLQMNPSSDASPPGSTGTNSSAPRSPLPASNAHVYVRNLILKGNGCPLYIPEPSGNSALYRTKGVRIGDVGLVTDDGYFKTLFNLRASIYDPINMRSVPDGFEQIDLHEDDIEVVPDYFKSGTIVASVTGVSGVLGPDMSDTPPAAGPSAVSNGHRLIWNTSEGAVLHLPNGSTRLTCDPGLFRDQAIKNGYKWYKYAWQTRRCDVRNGALCLVTGTDKTDTWMVGAFSQSPPGNQVLLSIGTDAAMHEDFPCSYSWIGTNPAMRLSKCRPVTNDTTVDRADMEQDDAVFRTDAPGGLTHSVFVRGFRISLRQSLWAYLSRSPLPAELSLIQKSAPEDFAGGQDRGQFPGSFSSVFSVFSSISSAFSSAFSTRGQGGDRSGGKDRSQTFRSGSKSRLIAEDATVEYVPTALPVDPAMAVNDLLLNLVPESQVAVIHDDEWHSLMQEDDADLPNSSELVTRLNRKYMLDVRAGCVSLLPIEGSLQQSSGHGSFPSTSRFSQFDQGSSRNVGDDLYLDPLATRVLLRDEGRKMQTSMPQPFGFSSVKNTVEPTVIDHAKAGASNFEIEHSYTDSSNVSIFGAPLQEVPISEDEDVIASDFRDENVAVSTLANAEVEHPSTPSLPPSTPTYLTTPSLPPAPVSASDSPSRSPLSSTLVDRSQWKRGKLSKETSDYLKAWLHKHSDHPYPSEEEKKQLCHATGLSMSQVSNWMINARRRILAPAHRAASGPATTTPSPTSGQIASASSLRRASMPADTLRYPMPISPYLGHHHSGYVGATKDMLGFPPLRVPSGGGGGGYGVAPESNYRTEDSQSVGPASAGYSLPSSAGYSFPSLAGNSLSSPAGYSLPSPADDPLHSPAGYSLHSPTGYSLHSPASLDAPTQLRKYTTPSATSRKDLPAVFDKKRTRLQAFGDDDEKHEEPLPPTATEKEHIEWKRRQNILAAQKSRKRKLQHQLELEAKVAQLSADLEMWKVRAQTYESMLRNHGIEVPDFSSS